MPTDQRSRAPQMPAGSSSLSERIAALQRKASSGSGRGSHNSIPTSSASYDSSAMTRSTSASSSSSSTLTPSQSQAVRDRIAKFQGRSDETERPLVPRSSFGAPAPNPDISADRLRVHKPYPGNMLRPQMTGGGMTTWDRKGAGMGMGMSPQLTGGAVWGNVGRRQASTPESLRTLREGEDAFAELNTPGLGSHAADVASLARNSKRMSLSRTSTSTSVTREEEEEAKEELPILPDTPTQEVSISIPVGVKNANGVEEQDAVLPTLPDVPRASTPPPRSPRLPSNAATPAADTSIEIEVSARSAEEMEAIRERARKQEEAERLESAERAQRATSPPTNGTGSHTQKQEDTPAITTTTASSDTPSTPLSAARQVISAARDRDRSPSAAPAAGTNGSNAAATNDKARAAAVASPTPSASGPRRSTIRRPPPGRVMSVAEMDASDDEYEPGWASVVSSSRGA